MAKIELQNLTKRFGKTEVFNDLDLEIHDGEFLVLLGPSGCGKTTTLRCIAGLEDPTAGTILFDGEDVTQLPPHQRGAAMVFQSSMLYPHLNVRRNIEMSLRTQDLSASEKEATISEITNMLGINHLLEMMPHEISGGERQRVATAKAIVKRPSVFLMDEPLSDLDASLRESLRAEIVRIQKELGITMVFVTHSQTEAMSMGDRIAVMNNGVIQQIGTPEEMYEYPQNTFVADFVGSPPMNLFDCRLSKREGQSVLSSPLFEAEIVLDTMHLDPETVGDEIIAGIRPQHISISDQQDDQSLFQAEIYAIEPLGLNVAVTLQIDSKKVKVLTNPPFKKNIMDRVHCAFDSTQIHLFRKDTRKRISSHEVAVS